jgi:hypothetical protein
LTSCSQEITGWYTFQAFENIRLATRRRFLGILRGTPCTDDDLRDLLPREQEDKDIDGQNMDDILPGTLNEMEKELDFRKPMSSTSKSKGETKAWEIKRTKPRAIRRADEIELEKVIFRWSDGCISHFYCYRR